MILQVLPFAPSVGSEGKLISYDAMGRRASVRHAETGGLLGAPLKVERYRYERTGSLSTCIYSPGGPRP